MWFFFGGAQHVLLEILHRACLCLCIPCHIVSFDFFFSFAKDYSFLSVNFFSLSFPYIWFISCVMFLFFFSFSWFFCFCPVVLPVAFINLQQLTWFYNMWFLFCARDIPWEDVWCGGCSLKAAFPKFHLIRASTMEVAKKMSMSFCF